MVKAKTIKKTKLEKKIKLEKKNKRKLDMNTFKPTHVLLGNSIKNKKLKLKLTFI